MKTIKLLAAMLILSITLNAQVVDRILKLDANTYGKCSVTAQIKLENSESKLGTATFKLKYDAEKYSFPSKPNSDVDYVFHNFSDGNYHVASLVKSKKGVLTINIAFNEGTGTLVTLKPIDIVTINFDVLTEEDGNEFELKRSEIYSPEKSTKWKLGKMDITKVSADLDNELLPVDYKIYDNYPNPFNPSTTIKYYLPGISKVNIQVYNVLGQKVDQLVLTKQEAGFHEIVWNASNAASGTYFLKIAATSVDGAKEFNNVKKMTLMK